MAPEATGDDGNGSSATEVTHSKPRKRKKSRSSMEATQNKHKKKLKTKSRSSGSAAQSTTSPLPIAGGDGNGDRQPQQQLAGDRQQLQQQQRGKARVVWTDELHSMFLKAYNVLGEDAVPKKILAMMNVDGLTRENVASHLQKHRLSLKREKQRIPVRRDGRPPVHAEEASNQMPMPLPSLHPPAQEPPPASSSLHPLPPQAPFAALNMSPLQIGNNNGQQLLQTPLNCFSSNDAATNLLLHPLPAGSPMVQLIHEGFAPPLEATATIAVQLKLVEKHGTVQQDVAGASGYDQMQVCQAVSMTAVPVPEVNMRYQEEEIHMVQLQMAAKAEEGQGRAADPGAADAGSLMSSPGNSIHGQYWKSDGVEVSWDYFGLPPYKPD